MSLPGYESLIAGFFRTRLLRKLGDNRSSAGLRAIHSVLFICLIVTANGQTINGSVYSYFGIGNLQGRSSAYNRALSYTGIAVRDDLNINGMNPASYNSINKPFTAIFEIGANYEATIRESGVLSSTSKTGGLNGINFMIKPSNKLGLMIGAAPLTNISYNASSAVQFPSLAAPTQIIAQGSGGINQFYLGGSYQVFKNFSVGANLSYYLGTIKKIVTVPPTVVSPQLIVNNNTTARNTGFDLGMQYSVPIKKTLLTFGAVWDPGASLRGFQQTSLVDLSFDTLHKTDWVAASYRMPPSYGGGIGWKTPRSTFAGDFRYINWKKAVMNDIGVTYQDVLRYSVGYEYRGNIYNSSTYLNLIALRGGFFIQNYPVVITTPFKTWGYTLGVSLPMQRFFASVNINYSFTQLGTTKGGLVREQSNKLVIDFVIRDIWGVKQKFD